MERVAWAEVISKILALVGVYLSVIFDLGFYWIVATVSLAAITNFILKAYLSRKELHFGFKFNPRVIKKLPFSLCLWEWFLLSTISKISKTGYC
jgi:hypothetical protein